MPSATPAAAGSSQSPHANLSLSLKPFPVPTTDMIDRPSSSSTPGPIRIDGSEHDVALSKSEFLTRPEVIRRRALRVKQLARIYRDHYWALMDELKWRYREYYWEYGQSPFVEDEEDVKINSNRGDCTTRENVSNNGNFGVNGGNNNNHNNGGNFANRCGVYGCKAKAMALTRFCHMHILSDAKQKLYKACNFSIKSSTTGPILCGKPILKSTVPSYCPLHFQKAEKHMARALKKAGMNVSSTSKSAPKFHVIVAEYVCQIKNKRKAAQQANLETAVVMEGNNS